MSFRIEELDKGDQRLYQRVADVLGEAGKLALRELSEAIWDKAWYDGNEEGYLQGVEVGRESAG